MKTANFESLSQEMLQHVTRTLFNKRAEYAGQDEDCLKNFKQPVSLMETNPAEVCMWYDVKHFASMVKIAKEANRGILPDLATLQEKVGDYLSYGLLYYACMVEMLAEQEVANEQSSLKSPQEAAQSPVEEFAVPEPLIDLERQAEFPLPMPGDLPPTPPVQPDNAKRFGFWNKK